jgi:hypothetical protein
MIAAERMFADHMIGPRARTKMLVLQAPARVAHAPAIFVGMAGMASK